MEHFVKDIEVGWYSRFHWLPSSPERKDLYQVKFELLEPECLPYCYQVSVRHARRTDQGRASALACFRTDPYLTLRAIGLLHCQPLERPNIVYHKHGYCSTFVFWLTER
eukprot:SAG31_NODE_614_length_13525_cov_4.312230_6_plen_109_part_00